MSTPPTAAALPPLQHSSALRALFDSLRRDNFLLILLAGFALLSVVAPN
ncbi:MAG: hypothetical protein JWR65_3588, partial [Massilia sp.]|nr:hypothetical protein [Massilia sp.]